MNNEYLNIVDQESGELVYVFREFVNVPTFENKESLEKLIADYHRRMSDRGVLIMSREYQEDRPF